MFEIEIDIGIAIVFSCSIGCASCVTASYACEIPGCPIGVGHDKPKTPGEHGRTHRSAPTISIMACMSAVMGFLTLPGVTTLKVLCWVGNPGQSVVRPLTRRRGAVRKWGHTTYPKIGSPSPKHSVHVRKPRRRRALPADSHSPWLLFFHQPGEKGL